MHESILMDEIVRLVRRLGRVPAHVELKPEIRLVEDLAIDSLDLVGVIVKIQDDYGVIIEDDDVTSLRSIADLAAYVAARMSKSVAA